MAEVTVKLTEEGPMRFSCSYGSVERGDELPVPEGQAERMVDLFGFERVDEGPETCEAILGSGDVCGRDLPCHYHS